MKIFGKMLENKKLIELKIKKCSFYAMTLVEFLKLNAFTLESLILDDNEHYFEQTDDNSSEL